MHKGALVSLVERESRMVPLGKVERKTADEAESVVVRLLRGTGRRMHTITSDYRTFDSPCHHLQARFNSRTLFFHKWIRPRFATADSWRTPTRL